MKEPKNIAVFFPGIGYTCDKPLLYYSAKLAAEKGYEVVRVPYGNFPPNVKGDAAKMYQCFVSAREQAEDILSGIDWARYQDILFFSKSVGTVFFSLFLLIMVIFYWSVFSHVALSFTNALVSLGWLGDMKKKKVADIIIWILCFLMFLAASFIITMTQWKMFNG